jgi:hypothetical protein
MENQLTIEQALQNIRLVLDNFTGTKKEHIALDLSYNKIVEELKKDK